MLKSVYMAVGDVLSSVSTRNSLQLQTKYLKKYILYLYHIIVLFRLTFLPFFDVSEFF